MTGSDEPLAYEPPYDRSRVDHVGTYRRRIPASLDRMYENALDWAHLSHLHASSFTDIECIDAGDWGWRATAVDARDRSMELELRLDRTARRWITRNLSGPSVGAEIWTHVFEVEPRELDLVIDFFVPGVPVDAREKVGRAYASAYRTLYDEDIRMMTQREAQLDRRIPSNAEPASVTLDIADISAPQRVTVAGREFVLNHDPDAAGAADGWVVYPAQCPHQSGPLDELPMRDGEVTCPWHGFRFDVVTGLRTDGGTYGGQCQLGRRPALSVQGGSLRLDW